MTKWKRLRSGKSARHAAFNARSVDSLVSNSSADIEPNASLSGADTNTDTNTAVSPRGAETEAIAACREPIKKLNLNSVDPYGCLEVRRLHRDSSELGAFLNRDVESGEPLALYTRDIITDDQQYDGRERRFIVQERTHDERNMILIGDGIKGRERSSYVRDHPSIPTASNTKIEIRRRGGNL